MEAARVDITYRPLRIGFALVSNDRVNLRKAVRLCHALWGGLYNPILAVDRPESSALVELFRPDFLVPLGADPAIAEFINKYPYLINPLIPETLFYPASHGHAGQIRILDVQNLIVHRRDTSQWKHLLESGLRVPVWSADDPLADMFLIQFGGFPNPEEIGIDYQQTIVQVTKPDEIVIKPDAPVPLDIDNHPLATHIGHFGIKPHYAASQNWNYPGIYVGHANDDDDLINFWNLRACGIGIQFLDLAYNGRTIDLAKRQIESIRADPSSVGERHRYPAIWSRRELFEQAKAAIGEDSFTFCRLGEESWNGLNIRPQRIFLGEEASLGVMSGSPTCPQVRFALKGKPFSDDIYFHEQHLVATVSIIGGQSDRFNYTFSPPYIPEINEFAARVMHYRCNELRIQPEGIGVIINTTTHDINLDALPVPALISKVFSLAGFRARISSSGLITRQLITRMGGVDGTRAFKIPGVRKLIKTHGPNKSFTKKGAISLIKSQDEVNCGIFDDHRQLYIEPREYGTKLTAEMVFSHLVAKGLFRIGVDLKCPACELPSWVSVDELRQQSICSLCGNSFDATRQLVEGTCTFRRSGILGVEKNAQGAIPVALLLQQLSVNLMGSIGQIYGVSHDLAPVDGASDLPTCETDFCVLVPTPRSDKTTIIIGECKDTGGKIDRNDIENMVRVSNSFPQHRFDVFILFAKLSPFTDAEIHLAKKLNMETSSQRVIMLTARELEPYNIYERTNAKLGLNLLGSLPEDLARATHQIYFAHSDSRPISDNVGDAGGTPS